MATRLSLLAAAAILATASGGHAASLPFTATLEIQFGGLPSIALAGAGTALVNGSGGGSHVHSLAVPGSTFATTGLVVPVTDPAAFPIAGQQVTAHDDPGNFADGGGTLGGIMPIAGVMKVCLFGPCASAVSNIVVPLSVVGQGGGVFPTGAANITVIGAPWTTGTAAVGTVTAMGSAHGPASMTSSTAAPSGRIQLVTPVFVSTGIGASAVIPIFGVFTMHFVPEPGTLALLGGGIALLASAGRASVRRRH